MKKFLSVLCAVAIAFCCVTYTAFAENTNNNGSISTYSLVFNTNESDLKVSGKIATLYLNIFHNFIYCFLYNLHTIFSYALCIALFILILMPHLISSSA